MESTELITFFNEYDILEVDLALEYNWCIPAFGAERALIIIFIARFEIIEFACAGCCIASAITFSCFVIIQTEDGVATFSRNIMYF